MSASDRTDERHVALILNGDHAEFPHGTTVRDVVAHLVDREIGPDGRATEGGSLGVAVALDDSIVPRSRWATTPIATGQTLEIVTAVQGG